MHTTPTPAQGTNPDAATLAARRQRLAATYADIRGRYSDRECAAIRLLYETAQRMLDTGGGSRCAKLLLGLYNGQRFRFDLTDLRCLDAELYAAARVVMDMDARRSYVEVHVLLQAIFADGRSVGNELETWAYRLRWGKHVKKDDLPTDFGPKWTAENLQ